MGSHMSNWQSLAPEDSQSYAAPDVDLRIVAGLGLMALGAALFAVGVFHGFAHGSCSTTGYTAHYGPVQHCGKGAGWWMLMLTGGIFVAGGGAALSGTGSTLGCPVLFVAIGAPFVALALRHDHNHLLLGSSSAAGKLSAGLFGAGFVIAGLIWGAVSGRRALARFSTGSRLAGLAASMLGIGIALALGAGVAGAIGSSPAAPVQPSGFVATHGSSARPNPAGNAALARAATQADTAEKLGACVTAAGIDTARILRCETRFRP
jgi:hypothetical protein